MVAARRFSGRKSSPDSGQEIVPIFWRALLAGNPGREILPIFWSRNPAHHPSPFLSFHIIKTTHATIFWARNPAHFLGAKSCPFSGRENLPIFRARNPAHFLGAKTRPLFFKFIMFFWSSGQ